MTGLSGGRRQATGVPMWLVEDIAAAVQRVRDAGGTSTEPQRQPYCVMADCTDDQGMHFYLGQL
jgi:predicted enzyme related to lactoylglutathione lyase